MSALGKRWVRCDIVNRFRQARQVDKYERGNEQAFAPDFSLSCFMYCCFEVWDPGGGWNVAVKEQCLTEVFCQFTAKFG
jgi:hypothetical protein